MPNKVKFVQITAIKDYIFALTDKGEIYQGSRSAASPLDWYKLESPNEEEVC